MMNHLLKRKIPSIKKTISKKTREHVKDYKGSEHVSFFLRRVYNFGS